MKYRRKAVDVIATQFTELGSHPAIHIRNMVTYYDENTPVKEPRTCIETDFGFVAVRVGDWVVEINGKVKILRDEYFKEHYELIPDYSNRPKLVFVSDCDN